MKHWIRWLMGALLVALAACSSGPTLAEFRARLDAFPEYSVILADMDPDGPRHRYRVVHAEPGSTVESPAFAEFNSDWVRVPGDFFSRHLDHLGMTILAKERDGEVAEVAQPPGYRYVGDPRHGEWRSDARGNSFWHFYGQYAMLRSLFGFGGGPVYRADWNTYDSYRRSGRPYFGPSNQYGTRGSYTKQSYKSFFDRRAAREASFTDRLKGKVRRSNMSGVRSRSWGSGK